VLRLCQEEDLDLNKIAETLSLDPALASKILRMGNSPIYGMRQQVRSVSQAIVLLGVNSVRTLALSFSWPPSRPKPAASIGNATRVAPSSYRAKSQGRNRTQLFDQMTPAPQAKRA
jgi:HD-like signal output (HDOD) protein